MTVRLACVPESLHDHTRRCVRAARCRCPRPDGSGCALVREMPTGMCRSPPLPFRPQSAPPTPVNNCCVCVSPATPGMEALPQRRRALETELAEATAQRRLLRRNARRRQEFPPRSLSCVGGGCPCIPGHDSGRGVRRQALRRPRCGGGRHHAASATMTATAHRAAATPPHDAARAGGAPCRARVPRATPPPRVDPLREPRKKHRTCRSCRDAPGGTAGNSRGGIGSPEPVPEVEGAVAVVAPIPTALADLGTPPAGGGQGPCRRSAGASTRRVSV